MCVLRPLLKVPSMMGMAIIEISCYVAICNFDRYYYNYDNFHILGILPVYGYKEKKVND
jgi:hypothetical protein